MGIPGLIPAAYAPFRENGDLDLPGVDRLADLYREQGLSGVFVSGTTGESHSLTVDERQALAARWVAAGDALKIVVHVGHLSQRNACSLASHAADVGAHAISTMAPFFLRPRTVEDLVEWCRPVAAAAGDLPFYFYDIPGITGVNFPTSRFLEVAATRIPTLAGIKFTRLDLDELQTCLKLDGGAFDILFGCDEALLAGLGLGARGAIGSTYNYAAPVYQRVWNAFEAGDLESARRHQQASVDLVAILKEYGVLETGKHIMELIGVHCGPVRAPLRPLTAAERTEVRAKLEALDIFSRPLGS